jgi:hypothetical protein
MLIVLLICVVKCIRPLVTRPFEIVKLLFTVNISPIKGQPVTTNKDLKISKQSAQEERFRVGRYENRDSFRPL